MRAFWCAATTASLIGGGLGAKSTPSAAIADEFERDGFAVSSREYYATARKGARMLNPLNG